MRLSHAGTRPAARLPVTMRGRPIEAEHREVNMMNRTRPRDVVAQAMETVGTAVEDASDVNGAIVSAVSEVTGRSLRGTRVSGRAFFGKLTDTIAGAVHGAAAAGVGVGESAQPIMVGAIRGARQGGRVSVEVIDRCAGALVQNTAVVRGNVGLA